MTNHPGAEQAPAPGPVLQARPLGAVSAQPLARSPRSLPRPPGLAALWPTWSRVLSVMGHPPSPGKPDGGLLPVEWAWWETWAEMRGLGDFQHLHFICMTACSALGTLDKP